MGGRAGKNSDAYSLSVAETTLRAMIYVITAKIPRLDLIRENPRAIRAIRVPFQPNLSKR